MNLVDCSKVEHLTAYATKTFTTLPTANPTITLSELFEVNSAGKCGSFYDPTIHFGSTYNV